MERIDTPGWQTAMDIMPEEILRIIDGMALRDYRDGKQLAPLWRELGHVERLICDCRDADKEARPGDYFLVHHAPLLYEGLCIAARALGATQLRLAAAPEQEKLARQKLSLWPEVLVQCCAESGENFVVQNPDSSLSHSAETFVRIAQLFRREGADKRLYYVSGCGIPAQYREVPLTSTLREIAAMAGAKQPSAALMYAEERIPAARFDTVPQMRLCSRIHFE